MGHLWVAVALIVLTFAGAGSAWGLSSQTSAQATSTANMSTAQTPPAPPAPPTSAPSDATDGSPANPATEQPTPGGPSSAQASAPSGSSVLPPSGSSVPASSPAARPTDSTLSYSTTTVKAPSGPGQTHDYIVAVEKGVDLKANTVAKTISKTLKDKRSWTGGGDARFALVKDAATAEFTIAIVSKETASNTCGGSAVCWSNSTVVIDASRWDKPPATYQGKKADFQRYLINHGVGFALGNKVYPCMQPGSKANVMQPQDIDLAGCKRNPWVHG